MRGSSCRLDEDEDVEDEPSGEPRRTEAPAQRRRTRCTMMHELSVPRRACPDSFSYLMIIAAILTSSSTLLGQPLEGE